MTDQQQDAASSPQPQSTDAGSVRAGAALLTGPVVVGIGTAAAVPAALWAAEECVRESVELHLVHCTGAGTARDGEGPAELLRRAAAAANAQAPGIRVTTRMLPGAPAATLIAMSKGARLVVVGEDSPAHRWSVAGSTTWTVAAHAHCPLVVWRPYQSSPSAPVVVGLDGSVVSAGALEFALTQASWRRVPLVAVMAWSDVFLDVDRQVLGVVTDWQSVAEDYRRLLAEQLAGGQERFPDVSIERVLTRDRPVRALLQEAASAQLLVVGSHGRGGFPGMLLGSVSRALVDYAPCPLAVVRP